MSALGRLAAGLQRSLSVGTRTTTDGNTLTPVIEMLQKRLRDGTAGIPLDGDVRQQRAVDRFWESQQLADIREARLVSFGLSIPNARTQVCVMEDRQRFMSLLDRQHGVGQWLGSPKWYRRCYQGLVRSYFTYDGMSGTTPSAGRKNWRDLRDYLHDHSRNIVSDRVDPDWVRTAIGNRTLFTEIPCAPYAESVLSGDAALIESLRHDLGIAPDSWFLRELVMAQVRRAVSYSDQDFTEILPRIVSVLGENRVLRDRGFIEIVNRYANVKRRSINQLLRDVSVEWWGNPWLPSNETRWGGVTPDARQMISEWLKREFIEAFFSKLSEDGVGDTRRAEFWLRYVKSMTEVHFGLGTEILHSRDPDYVALRKKMHGLIANLSGSTNNAFIMTFAKVVVVEFGDGGALYGYANDGTLPFDWTKPLALKVDGKNSLKNRRHALWMKHADRIHGWQRWEQMFEATIEKHFGIRPDDAAPKAAASTPPPTAPGSSTSAQTKDERAPEGGFSIERLRLYAARRSLQIEDLRPRNGNLWVRCDDNNPFISKTLQDWGFLYRSGSGWWR